MQQDPFLLRDDGVWVINLTVFSLKEEEQKRFMYPTPVEVLKALENLPGESAAGSGAVCLSVFRPRFLAVLQFAPHRYYGDLGDLAVVGGFSR